MEIYMIFRKNLQIYLDKNKTELKKSHIFKFVVLRVFWNASRIDGIKKKCVS